MVDFSDSDEAERWFRGQSRRVCIVMAVRMALRLFPLCSPYILKNPSSRLDAFVLPLLRAVSLPSVAGTWPARGGEVRAAAVVAAAATRPAAVAAAKAAPVRAEADAAAATAAFAAAASKAAATTTRAATAAAAARVNAFAAAANAFAAFDDTFAAAVAAKAAAAAADVADTAAIESGVTAAVLCQMPLWPDTIPDKIGEDWSRLSELLRDLDPNWSVWIDWYDDRLRGADDPRSRPLIEELEVERALIPDEEWEKGAAHVNALIAEIEAKYRAKVPEQKNSSIRPYLGDDAVMHSLPATARGETDPETENRIRAGWSALTAHLTDLQALDPGRNSPALGRALERVRDALGSAAEDTDVIGLGLHGKRIGGIAKVAHRFLVDDVAEDLQTFAAALSQHAQQFPEWRAYNSKTPTPVTEKTVAFAAKISLEISERPELADDDTRQRYGAQAEALQPVEVDGAPPVEPPDEIKSDSVDNVGNFFVGLYKKLPTFARRSLSGFAVRAAKLATLELLNFAAEQGETLAMNDPENYGWLFWPSRFLRKALTLMQKQKEMGLAEPGGGTGGSEEREEN